MPLDDDDQDEVGKNIFICNVCNSMVDETQLKSVGKVIFSICSANEVNFQCWVNISCYRVYVPITEKFKLARYMIKSYVNIIYSVVDFKITSIEKAARKIAI